MCFRAPSFRISRPQLEVNCHQDKCKSVKLTTSLRSIHTAIFPHPLPPRRNFVTHSLPIYNRYEMAPDLQRPLAMQFFFWSRTKFPAVSLYPHSLFCTSYCLTGIGTGTDTVHNPLGLKVAVVKVKVVRPERGNVLTWSSGFLRPSGRDFTLRKGWYILFVLRSTNSTERRDETALLIDDHFGSRP